LPDVLFDEMFPLFSIDLIFAKVIGFDSKWVHLSGPQAPPSEPPDMPELPPNQSANRTGQIYIRGRSGASWYHDGMLKTPELLRAWISYVREFSTPDPGTYRRFKEVWDAGIDKDILPIPTVGGPVYTSWSSIGLRRFSYLARKYANLVLSLFDAWADVTIECHKVLFEQGVDLVFICDDFAQKGRLIFNPRDFERFVKPIYRRMARNAHDHDAKLLVHTDGNISEVVEMIADAGVDAIEPMEYESGMRLKPIKEQFGNRLTLIGNVPASDALCVGSVEFTIQMTKRCIKDAARGGGFILSPSANVLASTKIENLNAMIKTAKKYGKYPINL